MNDLDLLILETETNPYVAAALTEHRMQAAEEFLEEWRETGAGDGETMRSQLIAATGYLAGVYEFLGQIQAVQARVKVAMEVEYATKYVALREAPTAGGKPTSHDDCKPQATKSQADKAATMADLEAAKIRIERRVRALDKVCSALSTTLRSLGDEARAFQA